MHERVFLGLGSNLGDRPAALAAALVLLRAEPGVTVAAVSSVYESEPVGPVADQPPFLNAVCELGAAPPPHELLDRVLRIERQLGRDRASVPRGGPRRIDVDILLYGRRVVDEPQLAIPHPELRRRAFVLLPLLELAPDLTDPRTGVPLARELAAVRGQRCVRTELRLR